ncbi:MAG: hypothetical protein AB7S75_11565 [Desulfococcaceae bacterium]
MKNFFLINGSLFFVAILIFFRCKSAKIPRSAEILLDLFQGLFQHLPLQKSENGIKAESDVTKR